MTTPPPTSNFFVCNDTGLHLHWDNQSKDYIIQQGKVGACVFKADIASKIVSDLNARYPDDTWNKVSVDIDHTKVIKMTSAAEFGDKSDYRNYTKS